MNLENPNTDMSLCSGVLKDESICPLADHCARFLFHLKNKGRAWYIGAAYDGMCKNFVETFKKAKNGK